MLLLLTGGYVPAAPLKLVGDRFRLDDHQHVAILRCACSDESFQGRDSRWVEVTDRTLEVHGFTLPITAAAALAGGPTLIGRDGFFRDLASMHGSYRKVDEPLPALRLIGDQLVELHIAGCRWLFDRPVYNSGIIGKITEMLAADQGWQWDFELTNNTGGALGIQGEGRLYGQRNPRPMSAVWRCGEFRSVWAVVSSEYMNLLERRTAVVRPSTGIAKDRNLGLSVFFPRFLRPGSIEAQRCQARCD